MTNQKGKVILAGAGPGDLELITLKLQRRLAEADVILVDRLVNPEIIERFANKNAEIILTGKQCYNKASFPQSEINNLIVEKALQGNTVLRLKGGDVAFFSNVLDELLTISYNNISFEIIPGITAASGISAYAGIPLTARGYAQGVQFLIHNPATNYAPEAWKHFATCNDTLVFYMAAKNLVDLADRLMEDGKNGDTPLAVIEQGTTVHQRVHISTLKECKQDFKAIIFSSPSIVIVGEVVQLHQHFQWFATTAATGSIFNKLVNQ